MADILATGHEFTTIYGRGLLAEIPAIAHRPYLVVTMPDLWAKLGKAFTGDLAGPYLVHTIDGDALAAELATIPACGSVVGLGGGQAVDVAKFIAWSRRLPLFQIPTSMSVNAAFGHRAGLRYGGHVRYVGYAVPEAVYVDFDVIAAAPPQFNRSGVCEVLCYHTAHADWRLARDRGRTPAKWPYDQRLVDAAKSVLATVLDGIEEIRDVSEAGIRTLMTANRWGGATFHNAGWNPCHIEGTEHFVFYALERFTGRKFLHGQPVCLGVVIGSMLHADRADEMLAAIHRVGVDIRPEAMGISWDDVAATLSGIRSFVREAGLWYSILDEAELTPAFVVELRRRIEGVYGPWRG
ncbi:MAG: iron-containing alcohol dehydrogenase [Planctomycetota bacterium]